MRKIKFLCAFGFVFAVCGSVALVATTTGGAVAETHLPSSASDAFSPQGVAPSPKAERLTIAPKTTKGAPESKRSRISDRS
ncbi:MAG: hypothetical protein ACR65U_13650 [Methylocystis sp.]